MAKPANIKRTVTSVAKAVSKAAAKADTEPIDNAPVAAAPTTEYKTGIVSFLDILGWRHLLANKTAHELVEVLETFRKDGNPDYKIGVKEIDDEWSGMYEYAVLSDCMFRCVETMHKVNRELPHGQMFHELLNLTIIQSHMAFDGYLIRGAVTYGQYFGTRDQNGQALFGPAIAKSYEMETDLANYPRIVIDPVLIDEFFNNKYLKNSIHKTEFEWSTYIRLFLRRDEAGIWFLDYLRAFRRIGDGLQSTADMYDRHKELVQNRVDEVMKSGAKFPNKVTEKVLWLLRYHNETMRAVPDDDWKAMGVDRDLCIVPVPDHPVFHNFEDSVDVDVNEDEE